VLIALFFIFGLVIGSFLNVCISRIPEDISIVSPGSRCPNCSTPIKPQDNIPVLSWFILRGKCRACSAPISPMYPAVELLTALLFVACYLTFGLSAESIKWLFFISLIIILTITDFRVRILPDAVNWFGFGLGLAFAIRIAPTDATCMRLTDHFTRFFQRPYTIGVSCSLLGALAGSGLLLGAATLYKLARGREGMGMGDVKMMLLVGSFLGIQATFFTLFLGTLLGSLIGFLLVLFLYVSGWKSAVAARANRRELGSASSLRWAICSRYQLPLGTFLGAAALAVVFFARTIDQLTYRFLR